MVFKVIGHFAVNAECVISSSVHCDVISPPCHIRKSVFLADKLEHI